ncbi:21934_t:CDS:2 [Cetraspora pellucida]|uniref:21934_t:CDS:1 n=1 Tax=Cetraspora pellucida TaxID=1433469 RepID=A0A9N9IU88_9GLOM|nr:21934_t:CDS:2 [Cetraspora pellucida]
MAKRVNKSPGKKQPLPIVEIESTKPTKLKENQKKLKAEIPLELKQDFIKISSRFNKYCKLLMAIIIFYIFAYLGACLQGFLFNLDGVVTTLLKSPFGQICFVINRSSLMEEEEKDQVIDGLTEINEQCKETLKKLGLLALVSKLGKLLEAAYDIIIKIRAKINEVRKRLQKTY